MNLKRSEKDFVILMKYLPNSNVRYDTNFADELLSTQNGMSLNLKMMNLKNYKAKAEYYIRQHQDNIAIAKLRTNQPLTAAGYCNRWRRCYGRKLVQNRIMNKNMVSKPLGEFVRRDCWPGYECCKRSIFRIS